MSATTETRAYPPTAARSAAAQSTAAQSTAARSATDRAAAVWSTTDRAAVAVAPARHRPVRTLTPVPAQAAPAPAPRRVGRSSGRVARPLVRPARLVSARVVAGYRGPAGQPCAARPAGGSIGWLVLVGVLAFVVVLGLGWAMSGQAAGSVPQRTAQVQVHAGDTLWSIAERAVPGAQPATVVDHIRQLNGLSAADDLYPGELLQVPAASAH